MSPATLIVAGIVGTTSAAAAMPLPPLHKQILIDAPRAEVWRT